MGMVPEVAVAMLACARIGAPHTVVFGGFAADALRDRIQDCGAKVVITQDAGYRRGSILKLKETVDHALAQPQAASVQRCFVYRHVGSELCPISMKPGRDVWWHEAVDPEGARRDPLEIVDAEHPLFILYTSGSTGKPKGVLHTTAGYLLGTHVTSKYVFDLRDEDMYWCTADVGWVTGHSYIVYGPLSNGATCLMYEGAPNFPDWGRFWRMIEKHRVSILYTAPTAIRAFMRQGDDMAEEERSVEPAPPRHGGRADQPEAWIWYHAVIGGGRCPIVDTWWQTETGAIMMTTLPGRTPTKPGSTGTPVLRRRSRRRGRRTATERRRERGRPARHPQAVALDAADGVGRRRPLPPHLLQRRARALLFHRGRRAQGRGRLLLGRRAASTTCSTSPATASAPPRVESALVSHPAVAEAAVVGRPDELKGQALVVFVTLKARVHGPLSRRARRSRRPRRSARSPSPTTIRFTETPCPRRAAARSCAASSRTMAAGRESTGDTSTLEDLNVLAIYPAWRYWAPLVIGFLFVLVDQFRLESRHLDRHLLAAHWRPGSSGASSVLSIFCDNG
jgi:acetyl-CoA synthetase